MFDLIRDFFVQHIFGGVDSLGETTAFTLGFDFLDGDIYYTSDTHFSLGNYSFSLGDYLSSLSTIISISLIVVLCCLFIWKIVKLVGGLIR